MGSNLRCDAKCNLRLSHRGWTEENAITLPEPRLPRPHFRHADGAVEPAMGESERSDGVTVRNPLSNRLRAGLGVLAIQRLLLTLEKLQNLLKLGCRVLARSAARYIWRYLPG